jgi:hypothetical protein
MTTDDPILRESILTIRPLELAARAALRHWPGMRLIFTLPPLRTLAGDGDVVIIHVIAVGNVIGVTLADATGERQITLPVQESVIALAHVMRDGSAALPQTDAATDWRRGSDVRQ